MTTYTPGPWRVEQWSYDNGKRVIPTIQNDKDAVAQITDLWCMDDRAGEAEANARLIAAAPEMAELLLFLHSAIKNYPHAPIAYDKMYTIKDRLGALLARISA